MKVAARLALVACAAALAAGSAAGAATTPTIVEAGGTAYPDRSYILTLPAARSLTRSEVHVTENGSAVSGVSIVRQGTVKSRSAVVLELDTSLTMKGLPLANALAAARAFAARANPNEQIAVVTFNASVNVLHGFTSSSGALDQALSATPKVAYGTKIYDALEKGLELITDANVSSGSIVILTDGQNVGSVAKPGIVLRSLANAHVRVFPVGLSSPAFKPAVLQQMASVTGGSFVEANGPSALRPILVTLGRRLSSEYLLTYRSRANPATSVAVRVSVKGFSGTAISAYTTPVLRVVAAKPYKPSNVDRLIQSNYTMVGVACLFAILLGFAVVYVGGHRTDPLVDRVGDFVSVQQQATKRDPVAARTPLIRTPAFLTRMRGGQADGGWYARLGRALDLAELEAGPYQLIFLVALMTFVVTMVLVLAVGVFGIAGLVTPLVVRALIKGRIAKKRQTFAEQLPDNLDVLASSLRAGHSLVSALSVVAEDASEPSKSEFQRVIAEEQFGVPLEDAFQVAVERMANNDLDQVALVARLQREMGSNSAEVLDRVVETVRARMELRRLIRTLTAQGRLSRWVLTALPVGLGVMLILTSRSYMHPLLHRPLGQVLLAIAAGMVFLGSWVIKRIVDIKVF